MYDAVAFYFSEPDKKLYAFKLDQILSIFNNIVYSSFILAQIHSSLYLQIYRL